MTQEPISAEELKDHIENAKLIYVAQFPPEKYGEDSDCEEVYTTLEEAETFIIYHIAHTAALNSPASGWVKVESEKDLPQKFGMHVCICHIIEDGISYYPASYQQFDTIRNEWTNPQICGKPCKVIKYLSEPPLPTVEELPR